MKNMLVFIRPAVRFSLSHKTSTSKEEGPWLVWRMRFGFQRPLLRAVTYRAPHSYPVKVQEESFTSKAVHRGMEKGFV